MGSIFSVEIGASTSSGTILVVYLDIISSIVVIEGLVVIKLAGTNSMYTLKKNSKSWLSSAKASNFNSCRPSKSVSSVLTSTLPSPEMIVKAC